LDCRGFYFEPNTSAWRKRFISNSSHRLTWVLVAVIAASYFYGLTPGHVFVQDDFAG
jgi:hypothetical protein